MPRRARVDLLSTATTLLFGGVLVLACMRIQSVEARMGQLEIVLDAERKRKADAPPVSGKVTQVEYDAEDDDSSEEEDDDDDAPRIAEIGGDTVPRAAIRPTPTKTPPPASEEEAVPP